MPAEKIQKVKYEKQTTNGIRTSYALRAEIDGQKLTKFVSKEDWERLGVPEEKTKSKQAAVKPAKKASKKSKKK